MILAILFAISLVAMVDILPYEGSTLALLIVAFIAIVALAVFRLLVPLIVVGVIIVVLLILLFGGIPVPG